MRRAEIQQRNEEILNPRPLFELCGCCDHLHPVDWIGDCRDDNNRYSSECLDALYGVDGWIERMHGEDSE